MNGASVIPEMTNPLGKHWEQPNRSNLHFDDIRVHMSRTDFDKIKTYQHTYPTGAYAGKMWKIKSNDVWILLWWVELKVIPGKFVAMNKQIRVYE